MAHEATDEDEWTCECGAIRVPDGDGGTVCINEDFTEEWPDFEMPDDAPTNEDVRELKAS